MSEASDEFFVPAFDLEPVLFAHIATVIQLGRVAKNASFRSLGLVGNNRRSVLLSDLRRFRGEGFLIANQSGIFAEQTGERLNAFCLFARESCSGLLARQREVSHFCRLSFSPTCCEIEMARKP